MGIFKKEKCLIISLALGHGIYLNRKIQAIRYRSRRIFFNSDNSGVLFYIFARVNRNILRAAKLAPVAASPTATATASASTVTATAATATTTTAAAGAIAAAPNA